MGGWIRGVSGEPANVAALGKVVDDGASDGEDQDDDRCLGRRRPSAHTSRRVVQRFTVRLVDRIPVRYSISRLESRVEFRLALRANGL